MLPVTTALSIAMNLNDLLCLDKRPVGTEVTIVFLFLNLSFALSIFDDRSRKFNFNDDNFNTLLN